MNNFTVSLDNCWLANSFQMDELDSRCYCAGVDLFRWQNKGITIQLHFGTSHSLVIEYTDKRAKAKGTSDWRSGRNRTASVQPTVDVPTHLVRGCALQPIQQLSSRLRPEFIHWMLYAYALPLTVHWFHSLDPTWHWLVGSRRIGEINWRWQRHLCSMRSFMREILTNSCRSCSATAKCYLRYTHVVIW